MDTTTDTTETFPCDDCARPCREEAIEWLELAGYGCRWVCETCARRYGECAECGTGRFRSDLWQAPGKLADRYVGEALLCSDCLVRVMCELDPDIPRRPGLT